MDKNINYVVSPNNEEFYDIIKIFLAFGFMFVIDTFNIKQDFSFLLMFEWSGLIIFESCIIGLFLYTMLYRIEVSNENIVLKRLFYQVKYFNFDDILSIQVNEYNVVVFLEDGEKFNVGKKYKCADIFLQKLYKSEQIK